MVDMSVREDHRIQVADRERESGVLLPRLSAPSLEHPTVESESSTVYVHEVA
jgi:hypothetical protein